MPSHMVTNPKLKAIIKRADEAYTDYLKKMKVLEGRVREILARVETKKTSALRSKIKKSK